MNQISETPSVPMETPEMDLHFCEFCEHEIESDSDEEFDPKDAVSSGMGYIHNPCILPSIVAKLNPDEKFEMVKLVHAMRIVAGASDELLRKFDSFPLLSTYLSGMKEEVDEQLELLRELPKEFCGETLIFVRTSAVVQGAVALNGAVIDARIDLQGAKDNGLAPVFIDIKSDRLNFLIKTRKEMREATA